MVGIGYDLHRLVDKRALFLGGIRIDFPRGLLGHSDGDVLIHAICDSLLGAAQLGDIGQHFPSSDERYKGISSTEILISVKNMLGNTFVIRNIDAIVIAEKPKILPYVPDMKKHLAHVLGISENVLSIKGKTNEGLDAIGGTKAIAAWAVCELERRDATAQR